MNKLPVPVERLTRWFDLRPLRERAMLAICLLVALFFLWDLLVLKPVNQQTRQQRTRSSELSAALAELQTQEQAVRSRRGFDPDKENKLRLSVLETEMRQLQKQLQQGVQSLISPQQMPEMLKDLLERQKKLRLLSLENLPAEALQLGDKAGTEPASAGMYRHRLRMEFSGDYLTTLDYLQELEKLPRSMVWELLQIETQDYPQAKVLLQVYTLSWKERWIGG